MSLIINFFKKYKYEILLALVVLIALVLRLMGLNKPYGLWFDEMMVYIEASKSFPLGIIKSCLFVDIHMPLYQLMLNIWMRVFGDDDLILRAFSVLIGTLSVVAIYFAGKELGGKRLGLIAAFLLAVNSCSIYYSQELKFYILLVLLSSISSIFFLRTINKPSKKNYAGLILSNLAIMYTFTIGIVFAASQFVTLLIYFLLNERGEREKIKNFLIASLIGFILSLPSIILLGYTFFKSKSPVLSIMSIFGFDVSSWFFLIQNWFAPKTNISLGNETNYFSSLFSPEQLTSTTFFVIVPLLMLAVMMIFGLKKNVGSRWIFLNIGILLVIVSVVGGFTDFVLTTRFGVIIIPLILLIAASGFSSLNSNFIRRGLLLFTCFIFLGYAVFSPNSANRMMRESGQKPPATVMKLHNFGKKDIVLSFINIAPDSLYDKYYNFEGFMMDASGLVYDPKIMKFQGIYADGLRDTENDANLKKHFQKYLQNPSIHGKTKDLFNILIEKRLAQDRYLMIVKPVGYTNDEISKIASNESTYASTPLYFLPIYKFQNDMISIAETKLKTERVYFVGSWKIYVFKKDFFKKTFSKRRTVPEKAITKISRDLSTKHWKD